MNKTIRMSTIVQQARDEYLWNGIDPFESKKETYSCIAIYAALKKFYGKNVFKRFKAEVIIDRKLESLGCEYYSYGVFDELKSGEEKQAARFMWLSFLIEATKNVKLKL